MHTLGRLPRRRSPVGGDGPAVGRG